MLAICKAKSPGVQQENRVDLPAEASVSSIWTQGLRLDATTSAHVFQKKAACATATSHLKGGLLGLMHSPQLARVSGENFTPRSGMGYDCREPQTAAYKPRAVQTLLPSGGQETR